MLNCIHKVFFFFDLYEIYVIEQAQRRENQLLTAEFYFAPSVGWHTAPKRREEVSSALWFHFSFLFFSWILFISSTSPWLSTMLTHLHFQLLNLLCPCIIAFSYFSQNGFCRSLHIFRWIQILILLSKVNQPYMISLFW